MVKSRLYVDRRESALNEAGNFLIPKSEGVIGDRHIVGEIGEILVGNIAERASEDEITLFKSLGIAIEDLAAAQHIFRHAQAEQIDAWLEIGGRHFGNT